MVKKVLAERTPQQQQQKTAHIVARERKKNGAFPAFLTICDSYRMTYLRLLFFKICALDESQHTVNVITIDHKYNLAHHQQTSLLPAPSTRRARV